jgi:hypothetical protein
MSDSQPYRFIGELVESGHGQFQIHFLRVLNFVVADAVEAKKVTRDK